MRSLSTEMCLSDTPFRNILHGGERREGGVGVATGPSWRWPGVARRRRQCSCCGPCLCCAPRVAFLLRNFKIESIFSNSCCYCSWTGKIESIFQIENHSQTNYPHPHQLLVMLTNTYAQNYKPGNALHLSYRKFQKGNTEDNGRSIRIKFLHGHRRIQAPMFTCCIVLEPAAAQTEEPLVETSRE